MALQQTTEKQIEQRNQNEENIKRMDGFATNQRKNKLERRHQKRSKHQENGCVRNKPKRHTREMRKQNEGNIKRIGDSATNQRKAH